MCSWIRIIDFQCYCDMNWLWWAFLMLVSGEILLIALGSIFVTFPFEFIFPLELTREFQYWFDLRNSATQYAVGFNISCFACTCSCVSWFFRGHDDVSLHIWGEDKALDLAVVLVTKTALRTCIQNIVESKLYAQKYSKAFLKPLWIKWKGIKHDS